MGSGLRMGWCRQRGWNEIGDLGLGVERRERTMRYRYLSQELKKHQGATHLKPSPRYFTPEIGSGKGRGR